MILNSTFSVYVALLCIVGFVSANEPSRIYQPLEGDNLLVTCNATEANDTFVYWSKNDTKSTFEQNGTDLVIHNINRKDSGYYICHLVNTSYPDYNETNANVTINVIEIDVLCKYTCVFGVCLKSLFLFHRNN